MEKHKKSKAKSPVAKAGLASQRAIKTGEKVFRINLENLKISPRFALFVLSLLYLYAELVFNLLMLDAAGTSMTTPREIDDIQFFGRMTSAFGFTLLVLGLFAKNGFVLKTPTDWRVAWATVFLCSFPLFLTYGDIIFGTITGRGIHDASVNQEMHWSFVTMGGCVIFLATRGSNAVFTIFGIVMMAFPAMFSGQKLLVERYVVSPTSWEQRLVARHMLMARSSAEECMIKLGTLDLCHVAIKNDDLRSLNAVFATYMAFAYKEVLAELEAQKETVLWNMVMKNTWFGVDEAYTRYLYKIEDANKAVQMQYENVMGQYAKRKSRFMQTLYSQYTEASSRYYRALDHRKAQEIAADAWERIEKKKNEGWDQYRRAAVNYNTSLDGIARDIKAKLMRVYNLSRCFEAHCERETRQAYNLLYVEYGAYAKELEKACGGDLMEHPCALTEKEIADYLHRKKDPEFIASSGLPPDLDTRAAFLAHEKIKENTDTAIREAFAAELEKQNISLRNEKIPVFLSQQDIENYIMRKMQERADQKWAALVAGSLGFYVPPGLSWEEFFAVLDEKPAMIKLRKQAESIPPPPEVEALNREQFVQKYIIPEYRSEAIKYFDEIKKEGPEYANGQRLANQGKDYVRAMFIPSIALGLSLFIAILTIGKNIIFLLSYLFKFSYFALGGAAEKFRRAETGFYTLAWGIFALLFSLLVVFSHNVYTENETYKLYYQRVAERSKPIAVGLDTIVRMQPIIYGQGQKVVDYLGGLRR
jgi:hypothetical protein